MLFRPGNCGIGKILIGLLSVCNTAELASAHTEASPIPVQAALSNNDIGVNPEPIWTIEHAQQTDEGLLSLNSMGWSDRPSLRGLRAIAFC